ncbi:MAG: ADP-ribosylation factor-like protein [Promethearchaeota archaeon]|jgi:signal recognition particle receptor subunit beta
MSQDQILCVSYFDQVIGPNTLYSSEPLADAIGAPDLGKVLEFNDEEGTFIFAARKYQTLNHIFFIDTSLARGGKDLIMITYMIKSAIFKDGIVDVFKYLDSKTPILENFALEMKDLSDLSSLLHLKKKVLREENVLNQANEKLKSAFLEIFNKYLSELTPTYNLETPIKSRRLSKKIFIIGESEVGKKTLLKNLELIQFLNVKKNDLAVGIFETIIENLEILDFDENECEFGCKAFESFDHCMNQAEGFIIIFKSADKDSILESKRFYQIIEEKRLEVEKEPVPILLIGNKFGKEKEENKELVHELFEIENLKKQGRRIRYFPIKILEEDDRVMKSIRWMIKNIL